MKKTKRSISTRKKDEHQFATSVERYAKKRIASLAKHIDRSQSYFAIEDIHDLRVEIKRIRAVFDLMNVIMPSLKLEKTKSTLRPLFKSAGRLRDIDIQQGIVFDGLAAYELSEYYNYLKKQELVLRPEFIKAADSFSRRSLGEAVSAIHSALRKRQDQRIQVSIMAYTKKNLTRIRALSLQKKQSVACLHEIRKRAKLIRYTLDVWGMSKTRSYRKLYDNLKAIATCLGEWHDCTVLSEAVQSYLEHDAPSEMFNAEAYTKFLQKLQRQGSRKLAHYESLRRTFAADILKPRLV